MIAEKAEKERLGEILYHYSHCITAMDDVKSLIVHKKEVQAINKLKDIKTELTTIGTWLKDLNDKLE